MNPTSLVILPAGEYFAEITAKIGRAKAGERVALMAMSFDPSELVVASLVHEVIDAAQRGAQVQLNVDAHAFMIHDSQGMPNGPLLLGKNPRRTIYKTYRYKLKVLEQLAASGGRYRITNLPRRSNLPIAGRSHIKYTVVNGTAYLGGCNLNGTDQIDFMVRLEDPKTADWIYNFMLQVAASGSPKKLLNGQDVSLKIEPNTTLLVDAGRKSQSIIYDNALKIIDDASERLVLTCQFFPGGAIAQHLAAALARGVDIKIYYSHIS
ncbi:MAG: phospholipase D-like domain-containing protein, partial [Candidatus Saccharimonadales bacterium]